MMNRIKTVTIKMVTAAIDIGRLSAPLLPPPPPVGVVLLAKEDDDRQALKRMHQCTPRPQVIMVT